MKVQREHKNISMAYEMNEKEQLKRTKEAGNRNSVYAGGLLIAKNDAQNPIEQKKQMAKKQAMKVIDTAFAKEMEIEEDLKDRAKNIEVKQEEISAAQQEINKINQKKRDLKEYYGITDDSTEATDLKLLEKRRDIMRGASTETLSEEETKRLEQIDTNRLTDYQTQSLELDTYKEPYQKTMDENCKILKSETETITAIKLSRLKSHPILDAAKEAEKIEEAARKEATLLLLDEAKDHMDETLEERVEEAKEGKETKKEEKDTSDTTNQLLSPLQIQNQVEKDMKKIAKELQMSDEDMKGISVDTTL